MSSIVQRVAVLLTALPLLAQEPEPPQAARDAIREILGNDHYNRPGFVLCEQCDRLMSDDPRSRQEAAEMLHALVVEMARYAEEVRDGPDSNRYFVRRRRARIERDELSGRLGSLPLTGDEAVPALLWIWRHGEDGIERGRAAFGMTAVPTAAGDRFFQQVLAEQSTVGWACFYALERVEQRGMAVPDEVLLALCDYHQEGVRRLAAQLAAARDLLVDPTAEKRLGKILRRALGQALELAAEQPPAKGQWIRLRIATSPRDAPEAAQLVDGWLLTEGRGDTQWRVLTCFGAVMAADAASATMEVSDLHAYVGHLLAERERWASTSSTEVRSDIEGRQGMHRSSFGSNDTWRGSPAELLAAAWSMQRGNDEDAMRLLAPLLAEAWDTRDVLEPILMRLTSQLDEAMLVAFARNRDYERALALATRLSAPELEDHPEHERAVELRTQLPLRSADFHTLQLPGPQRWQELRETLTRAEQIRYLVERLQLLSCEQWSNPGALSYDEQQFGQAGMAGRQGGERDPRINPFVQLLKMDLAADELGALLPALESRYYILGFDMQRFASMQPTNLHRVSWVAATICNEVAMQPIADSREFLGTKAERELAARRLIAFGQEHAGQKASDLMAAGMLTESDWQEVCRLFWHLHSLDPVRAFAVMREVGRRRADLLPQIVRLIALVDRSEFVGEARSWLDSADQEQSFFAAVLLVRHRQETDRALAVIQQQLAREGGRELVPATVDALLACERPAARQLLERLLAGEHPSGYTPTAAFCQRLMAAGMSAARDRLQDAVAGKQALLVDPWLQGTPADQLRVMTLAEIASWWPDIDVSGVQPERPESIDALATKLGDRLAGVWQKVAAGKQPGWTEGDLRLPWGELLTFSSGWIRRM